MGTQGSLKYYENRDPGPHFSMKMGTRGPHFGGSLFSYDTGSYSGYPEPYLEVQVDSKTSIAVMAPFDSRLDLDYRLCMLATILWVPSDAAVNVSFRLYTPLAFVAAMASASSPPEAGPSSQSSPSPLSSPSVISSSSEESLYTSSVQQ